MKKEELEIIVKNSKTITEVIRKLGLRAAGGNFKSIRKRIDNFNIDISHFNPEKVRKDKLSEYINNHRKKNIQDYLTTNSTYDRTLLKKRLYKEGLKIPVCEMCGQDEWWMGKKISLILDHKNGIWNDNRLDNLRIICPNCNASLDTHCGRNNHKKIEIKTNDNKFKSYLLKRKIERPDYTTLISEINQLGYVKTGRKYGVSDNAIRKWIKTYEKYGDKINKIMEN